VGLAFLILCSGASEGKVVCKRQEQSETKEFHEHGRVCFEVVINEWKWRNKCRPHTPQMQNLSPFNGMN